MTIEPRPDDPLPRTELRASDADRDAVAQRLQDAASDGRLGLDELEGRLDQAYRAKTYGELDAVTRDLAVPEVQPAVSARAGHGTRADQLELHAPMDDVKREGPWHVPAEILASAGLGTIKLDFTEAILSSPEVRVHAIANVGSVVLLVPEGWHVDVDGVRPGMGSIRNKAVPPKPGAPHLLVTGRVGVGDVVVRHPRTSRWLPR